MASNYRRQILVILVVESNLVILFSSVSIDLEIKLAGAVCVGEKVSI